MFKSFFKDVFLVLSLTGLMSTGFAGAQPLAERPICRVDYYFTPGCEQCRSIEENILPQIEKIFGDQAQIYKHNLYVAEEYAETRRVLARLAIPGEDNVFVVIDGNLYVGGPKNIERDLAAIIEEQLHSVSKLAPLSLKYAVGRDNMPGNVRGNWLKRRTEAGGYSFPFPVLVLLTAGLIDGLNPCAFATIIFLVSFLLAGGRRRGGILLVGMGFCGAVYLTYLLIGLGLFQVFRMSVARLLLDNVVNWLLILALLVLALVSFRDAWIFRLTGRTNAIILKLPGRINRIIHYVIRRNLSPKHYFAGGFFLGCLVTILESVCTGQLYVPALVFLARTVEFRLPAIVCLALYNLMFILPLVAVFILAYYGASHRAFIEWSRKDVFWSKCALGCFFIFLAVVLYLT